MNIEKPVGYILQLLFIIFFGLSGNEAVCESEKSVGTVPVFVSIEPQAYFVERIGGSRVSVNVIVSPGKNPATYAPAPDQMSQLAKAKIYFRIGVPFENSLIPKIQNSAKHLHIVDTRKNIPLRKMAGSRHHHEAGGNDPHIWLSPVLVKRQAETIFSALVRHDPVGKKSYAANYQSFIDDLDRLHRKTKKILEPARGETFFVFHPSFGYFTDTYGLRQLAIEMEGKAPKGKALSRLIKKAKKENIRVVFVQPQFDRNAAQKIADTINGVVVELDPMARDYIKNFEEMVNKVAKAFQNR